jgi:CheY-like chemotaxis protein
MKEVHILLVEDNAGDIFLIREALEENKVINKLSVIKDGVEVMDFLRKEKDFGQADTPDLILLDINLPKKNGLEILEEIKTHEEFKKIPVIILTTSASATDISESYRRYANCFITKPVEAQSFLKVITSIENYWIKIVTLPNNM